MNSIVPKPGRDSIRHWVDTWRAASRDLEDIRRQESASVNIHDAVRQLFDGMEFVFAAPSPGTSGLVEQQLWFSRIRASTAGDSALGPRPAQ